MKVGRVGGLHMPARVTRGGPSLPTHPALISAPVTPRLFGKWGHGCPRHPPGTLASFYPGPWAGAGDRAGPPSGSFAPPACGSALGDRAGQLQNFTSGSRLVREPK